MKTLQKISAAFMSLAMVVSFIPAAAAGSVQIEKEGDPATLNWNSEEVAYIDFSEITEEIPTSGIVAGNGLSLVTGISTGNTRAANIVDSDGYLLLGKEARTNDNPADMAAKPKVSGAIYVKMDAALADKANTDYAVKINYYGGGIGVDSGSYIDFCYNATDNANKKIRNKYGATYNSGLVETMYYTTINTNFCEKVNNEACGADFRLETWTGAQLKIRRISLIKCETLSAPIQNEVRKGIAGAVASFDVANVTEIPEVGIVNGDALNLYTTQDTGSALASNIYDNGYILLGRQAHQTTDAETADVTFANGAVYFKLSADNALKANTPYAVKVEYYGGGLGLDGGSYIDLRYNTVANGNSSVLRKGLGSTYNSGKDEVLYFPLANANLNGSIQSSTCGADFRLETWCGNGTTTGAQIKIKKVSVVEYDPSVADSRLASCFSIYSEGDLKANEVVTNINTGEYVGITYPVSAKVVALNDESGTRSYAVQPAYDGNGLGTLGIVISDSYVKAAVKAIVTVSYWDIGSGNFSMEYNAAANNYQPTETVAFENTQQLKTYSFVLNNTAFSGAQTGGFDFKLLTRTADFCIQSVKVESVIAGDVNEDGILNAQDLVLVRDALLIGETSNDINGDGQFNIKDLVALKKLIANA